MKTFYAIVFERKERGKVHLFRIMLDGTKGCRIVVENASGYPNSSGSLFVQNDE